MNVGIASYGALQGATAATTALQVQVAATNAATSVAGNAIVPAGVDSASAFATGNQISSNMQFTARVQECLGQMQAQNAVLTKHSAESAGIDAVHAATLGTVNGPVI